MFNNKVQLEIVGNYDNVPVGFYWDILHIYNKDLIYLSNRGIIIKDQDAIFRYPEKVKFISSHFQTIGSGDEQKIVLNPHYLIVLMNMKGLEVRQKMSVYDYFFSDDSVLVSSCSSTYTGQSLSMEYEYPSHDMGVMARYVGKLVMVCTAEINRETNEFIIKLEKKYILNSRMNVDQVFQPLKFDSPSAVQSWLVQIRNENYYRLVKHTLDNFGTQKKPFGYRKN